MDDSKNREASVEGFRVSIRVLVASALALFLAFALSSVIDGQRNPGVRVFKHAPVPLALIVLGVAFGRMNARRWKSSIAFYVPASIAIVAFIYAPVERAGGVQHWAVADWMSVVLQCIAGALLSLFSAWCDPSRRRAYNSITKAQA